MPREFKEFTYKTLDEAVDEDAHTYKVKTDDGWIPTPPKREHIELAWSDIEALAKELAQGITEAYGGNLPFKAVYGVPRGGIPAAMLVARELGLPMAGGTKAKPETWFENEVLVVDDIADSGNTLKEFPDDVLRAVLYCRKGAAEEQVNWYARLLKTPAWVVFPWEQVDEPQPAGENVVRLLQMIGEDPNREGLKDTPSRYVRALTELTGGYTVKVENCFEAVFDSSIDELIVIPRIEFFSLCEHHILPFFGHVHIGYIPKGKVLGLSKFGRLVDCFAKRLQIQENMTEQIADAIEEHLAPLGVGVVVEAKHLCVASRGVGKRDSGFVTSSLRGVLRTHARSEFMRLAGLSA